MKQLLHITSGDSAGGSLSKAGLTGEVLVWHDILYDGPRSPGWPDNESLTARATFLEKATGGGLSQDRISETLKDQYRMLEESGRRERIILWFDACLFDQSMLVHILSCLCSRNILEVDLLCIDSYPGIEPFDGLGQLEPDQLAECYDRRRKVKDDQFAFAEEVDTAFALHDVAALEMIAALSEPPLRWIPAAVARWLVEEPNPATGLGRLESLAFEAIRKGCDTPGQIFKSVANKDVHPQYWGDTTLWAKINALADREPPLVHIDGPAQRLPQWTDGPDIGLFTISANA